MSDQNTSLPIRTQSPGDVQAIMSDGTIPSQYAKVDASGNQYVIISNTTLAPAIVMDVADGPVAPGTAASYSTLVGAVYNSTLPTLTNGQQAALQVNASGVLLVSQSNFPTTVDTNYGTVGANTIRTAAQIGNATGAADFNWGTVGAQTLRTAAEIGNAGGSADFNAGSTGAQTLRTVANQGAPNTVANSWPILLTNGTNTASVSAGGELSVTVSTALPAGSNNIGSVNQGTSPWIVEDLADGSVTGGTAGTFSQLAGGIYNSAAPTLTNGQQAALQLTAAGALIVSATLPYDTNWGAVGATTLRTAAEIGNASGAADFNAGATGAQTLRTVANQGAPNTVANSWPIEITDGTNIAGVAAASTAAIATQPAAVVALSPNTPLPAGTNLLGGTSVYVGSSPNSATNPVFVTSSDTIGTSIDHYLTSAAVAAGSSVNMDYTVSAGKTFYSKQVWATASGKIKVQVEYETAAASGIFNTVWVGFNSTADTNILIPIPTTKTQVTGARIRIVMTNNDLLAMDLYSTLSGTEQ